MKATHLDAHIHPRHTPVLLQETYQYLVTDNVVGVGSVFRHLDCNFGDAGHVEYFAAQSESQSRKIQIHAIDADQYAIDRGLSFLKAASVIEKTDITVHKGNFKDLHSLLPEGLVFNSVLFDLGLSTYQLGQSERGFSFKYDEPLDMRFNSDVLDSTEGEFTAYDIVNYWSPDNIALILRNYADEKRAWKIATAIETARSGKSIETSKQLADLIVAAIGIDKKSGIHPATKTFQALRIAVNNEIQILTETFEQVLARLAPQGRIGVISYHSLEDTVVKRQFKKWEEAELGKRINKKVIVPTREEEQSNPRSRSAKFRVFQKN